MACNASKTPFLRIVAKRGFSAQASPAAKKSTEAHTTTLPNKLVVATADSHLPVSRVSIIYKAGSRNEAYDQLGASHMLRLAGGLSTKRATSFGIFRPIHQIGGSLSVTSDREVVSYTLVVASDHLEAGLKHLQDAATSPAFKPWEISDNIPRLRIHRAAVFGEVRAVDLVHKAAFRTGLGNSVFCPKHQIGKISSETLQHYFASNCTTNRCSVVGVGVDHRTLVGYAQNLDVESGAGSDKPSKYHGSEMRKDKSGRLAYVAVAGEGAGLNNMKEAYAFEVLKFAAGVEPAAKRGNVNGALGKVVGRKSGSAPVAFSALNVSYTDAGLFGFVVSGDGNQIGKAVESAVKALKTGSISAEDVARGKALLKGHIQYLYETDAGQLKSLSTQASLLGNVLPLETIIADVDAVTAADVSAAARKVASSKLSMGAVGNLASVPYISDLN